MIIFTDLDGTLLDHHSYSYDPARPALDALRAAHIPLILATSKTRAEVQPLHTALGLGDLPAIVENGAGIYWPGRSDAATPEQYRELRTTLDTVSPDLRSAFEGFGDLDVAGVSQITGLPMDDAARARDRQFSEPGLWHGDAASQAAFIAALQPLGIHARSGGRFLTLSFGARKVDAMAQLQAHFGTQKSIALGDAPNDVEMLEAADLGIVIPNPDAPALPPLKGEGSGKIRRAAHPGPMGWNIEVLRVLQEQATT